MNHSVCKKVTNGSNRVIYHAHTPYVASIALAATGGRPLRQVITDDNLRDLNFKSDDELYC